MNSKPQTLRNAYGAERWKSALAGFSERLQTPVPLMVQGRLTRMVGLTLEAVGVQAAVGDQCGIETNDGRQMTAEVVGFAGDRIYLMPTDITQGLSPHAKVTPLGTGGTVAVGNGLLGRVIDGGGQVLDGLGPLQLPDRVPLGGRPINPLAREPIHETLDVGVRAINSLLSVGRGQRLGLFAPSGVGKSVLLGMMTRYTEADVIVVGLIGERGREVKEFIEQSLGEAGLKRSVVVATPADYPPLMRMHGASMATAIAEYFRDQGRHVLLLMDSLTRYAQAQREIALAIGEPPATRGYPPSVFARLPHLVERAGTGGNHDGTITAIYTVLTDGPDANDPITDAARAILDGHIVLSRKLAESGHYPAIDIEASISRVMNNVVSRSHIEAARRFRQVYSLYEQNRDLFNVGAYQRGQDAQLDQAVELYPRLKAFLTQDVGERHGFTESVEALTKAFAVPNQA